MIKRKHDGAAKNLTIFSSSTLNFNMYTPDTYTTDLTKSRNFHHTLFTYYTYLSLWEYFCFLSKIFFCLRDYIY